MKNLIRLIILLTSLTIFWGCEKHENTEKEEIVVAAQDSIVGKWFQKNYEQSYYQNNGTVKSGGSSTVDFDVADFIEFRADGTYKNGSVTAKYKRAKDKITVTGLATATGTRDFYIKQLTATDLQLFYTTYDSENYRYETLLTYKK